MSDVFISYKREEQPVARKLANALEAEGWTVWWDPKLRAGERFNDVIENALNEAKCVIVLWSERSVRSKYVIDEATYALDKDKLVPVLIENVSLPFRFKGVHTRKLLDWDGSKDFSEFRKLVEDIAAIAGSPVTGAGPKAEQANQGHVEQAVPNPWRRYGPLAAGLALLLVIFSFVFWWPKEPPKGPVNGSVQLGKKQEIPGVVDKSPFPVDVARAAYFFDDFSADKLKPYWKVLDPNPSKWTLQSNKSSLLIITERGSISGSSRNLKNQFVLDRSMPKGNYEVIAKASFQIQGTLNSISIALFRDDENFLELSYWGQPTSDTLFSGDLVHYDFYRTVSFVKEEGGQRKLLTVPKDKAAKGPSDSPRPLLLKIERDGNQYTGYYAPFSPARPPQNYIDDVSWLKIGTHALIDFDGKLSLWANNGNANIYQKGPPPEVAAEFDFVLVRER
jgi:TIR domain